MKIGEIKARFDRAAANYERHAALEHEVAERLMDRAAFVRKQPRVIVDLGCGTGRASRALAEKFETATVIGLDLSGKMLDEAVHKRGGNGAGFAVQADLTSIPLSARSVDLIFSSLALQWAGDFGQAMNEIRRVLRPGGMFMFSVPGPNSLRELQGRTAHGGSMNIPIYMPDLQDVGDLLVSAGFTEPVMDAEVITLNYPSVEKMDQELAVTGGAGFADLPLAGLENQPFDISFEVVYGLAFGPPEGQPVRTPEGEVATFSVDQLRRR